MQPRSLGTIYIGAVALISAGLTTTALMSVPLPTVRVIALATIFVALMTLASLFPLPFAFKTKLCLDTAVIIAVALCFAPGIALLIAGAGKSIAHLGRLRSARQTVFNTAQAMLQAAVGAFILTLGNWDRARPDFGGVRCVLLLGAAGIVIYLLNTASVAVMVGLQSWHNPVRFWIHAVMHSDRIEHLSYVAQVGLGLLAAMVAMTSPWALGLLVLPILPVYIALDRHLRFGKQAGETQRIARLGDWVWNLDSGVQIWSDEMYRILGFAPQAFVPSYEAFLRALHPEDRTRVNDAVHDALSASGKYSLDHRILLPDGAIRIVHQQGEVIQEGNDLRRMIVTVHDITERKALEEQLAHQAFHDALTNLPNRAYFLDRLQQALAHPESNGPPIVILYLDLDRFKIVNDSLGHTIGDELLIMVGQRLKTCIGPEDIVARFGGDEFTMLLMHTADRASACRLADRVMAVLEAPFRLADHEIFITTSMGIVLGHSENRSPVELLREADVALYRAKGAGKARYAIFDTSMNAFTLERLNLETDLRRALEHRELRLHYQPIVDVRTGQIAGFESLPRWEHPRRGPIPPTEIIPLAEETGLIIGIGRWVLDEACRQAKRWEAEQPVGRPVYMSVNLSAKQFQQPDLSDHVADALAAAGLDPSYLILEITENVIMENAESTVVALARLKALGVRLAIDDFGTGYSSLSYLKRFSIDFLKLDKSFVDGLGEDRNDAAIVRAVVNLGDGLGIRVIAEGVETMRQWSELRRLGCDYAQGYHFGKPLPAVNTIALLTEQRTTESVGFAVSSA